MTYRTSSASPAAAAASSARSFSACSENGFFRIAMDTAAAVSIFAILTVLCGAAVSVAVSVLGIIAAVVVRISRTHALFRLQISRTVTV